MFPHTSSAHEQLSSFKQTTHDDAEIQRQSVPTVVDIQAIVGSSVDAAMANPAAGGGRRITMA